LLLLPWLLGAIPQEPPPPLALTEAEEAALAARKVVSRVAEEDQGGEVTGIIDVAAPLKASWDAIHDFVARKLEIKALHDVSVYTPAGVSPVGVRWHLRILGSDVIFHLLYRMDPAQSWTRYALDTSQSNDVVAVEGAYQVLSRPGGSRIIYRSFTDSGRRIPAFIRNWLAVGSLEEQLEGMRRRAETGGAR
jgi:hypothetical protein